MGRGVSPRRRGTSRLRASTVRKNMHRVLRELSVASSLRITRTDS